MPKLKVALQSLLLQGLSEPELYSYLVYKLKTNLSRTGIYDQLKNYYSYKHVGYDINVMRQSAC